MESGQAPVAPPPEPELLEVGPTRDRRSRMVLPIALALLVVLVVGSLAWQFWPRPVAPLTLDEVEGIYAGMVRGDGTNDASVLPPPTDSDARPVRPEECRPLFDPTEFSRQPVEALDGVGTYWMNQRDGGSMFSYRFVDAAVATEAYGRIDAALTACDGRRVQVGRPVRSVQVHRTEVTTASGISDQLGYLWAAPASSRYAVHVLRFENLITWQFRLDTTAGDYSPLTAQQLMDSLVLQIRSVVALRQ